MKIDDIEWQNIKVRRTGRVHLARLSGEYRTLWDCFCNPSNIVALYDYNRITDESVNCPHCLRKLERMGR